MDTLLTSPYLLLFARLTLGGIFLLGAVGKLLDLAASEAAMRRRTWLPAALVPVVGRGLPVVEAIVGTLLVIGGLVQGAALVAGILLVGFTISVLLDLRGGTAMPCHCFGSFSRETVSPAMVVRNLLLLILAVLLAWHPVPYLAVDALTGVSAALPPLVNAVPIIFLALITIVAVVLGHTLLETVRGFLRAF